jgi:nucleotide-binding universal stress UspA family protein
MTYRIVVGVDGSVHGNAALRWALDEALAHAAEIIAVFAWQMPFIGIPGAFDREEMERICKRFLEETVAAIVPEPRVPMTKLVAEGDVSASLIAAAKGADMLVLGSRGWRLRRPQAGLGQSGMRSACSLSGSHHQATRGQLRRASLLTGLLLRGETATSTAANGCPDLPLEEEEGYTTGLHMLPVDEVWQTIQLGQSGS